VAAAALAVPSTRSRPVGTSPFPGHTVTGRVLLWGETARLVGDRPLLGVGPGGYADAIPTYHDARYERRVGAQNPPDSPHDRILQAAAAGRLPLALLAVALAVLTLARGRRAVEVQSAAGEAAAFGGMLAGLVGYGVTLLFHFTSPGTTPLAAVLGDALLADPARAGPVRPAVWRRAAGVLGALAWAALAVVLASAAVAELPLRSALDAAVHGRLAPPIATSVSRVRCAPGTARSTSTPSTPSRSWPPTGPPAPRRAVRPGRRGRAHRTRARRRCSATPRRSISRVASGPARRGCYATRCGTTRPIPTCVRRSRGRCPRTDGQPPARPGCVRDIGLSARFSPHGRTAATAALLIGAAILAPPAAAAATATSTTLSASRTSVVSDEGVTLTAMVGASGTVVSSSSGTVEFLNGTSAIPGCSSVPFSFMVSATCDATFAAVAGPTASLTATFVPASGSAFASSTSGPLVLSVTRAATGTGLELPSTAPTAGAPVTLTAGVAGINGPVQPTGTVTLMEDGTPIAACAGRPLAGANASCTTSFPAGEHSLSASFSGDANFAPSSSPAETLTVRAPPTIAGTSGTATGPSSARFATRVDPDGLATRVAFEYGPGTRYTAASPAIELPASFTAQPVSETAGGLLPNARYHVRAVAVNARGTAYGTVVTVRTPRGPPPPRPVPTRKVNVTPVAGTVFVELRPTTKAAATFGLGRPSGRVGGPPVSGVGFVPLTAARQIPVGSQIDARAGTVRLSTASTAATRLYAAVVTGGVFTIQQGRAQAGLTTLRLLEGAFPGGPSYSACTRRRAARVVNRLQVSAMGPFQTRGRDADASARDAQWTTIERCDGTLTRVQRGEASVLDLVDSRRLTLTPRRSFLAARR
jgi:hypothetical protein